MVSNKAVDAIDEGKLRSFVEKKSQDVAGWKNYTGMKRNRRKIYKFKGPVLVCKEKRAGDDGLSRASEKRGADRPVFGVTRAFEGKAGEGGETILGAGIFFLFFFFFSEIMTEFLACAIVDRMPHR